MTENKINIAWIDVETNGVDASKNSLLEVACIVTDINLNILSENYYTTALYYSKRKVKKLRDAAIPYVQTMHDKTNLWNLLSFGKKRKTVDKELFKYLKQFNKEPKALWFGGNSITLDRNFLQANLPKSFNHLNHRSIDVTSIASVAHWHNRDWIYKKQMTHNALDDIKESIAELKYFKEVMFNVEK